MNLPISKINHGHSQWWRYFHTTLDTLPQSSMINLFHTSGSESKPKHFHFHPKEFSWSDLASESVYNIHESKYTSRQYNLSITETVTILLPSIFWPHQTHAVTTQNRMETVPSFLPACFTFVITVLWYLCGPCRPSFQNKIKRFTTPKHTRCI